MTGRKDILLQVEGPVSEGCGRLLRGLRKGPGQLGIVSDEANSPPPAAGAGLEHDRISDVPGQADGFLRTCHRLGARNDRQAGISHQIFQKRLVCELLHEVRIRPDEYDAVVPAEPGEVGVLREKAIARMDGLGSGHEGRRDDLFLVQIGRSRLRSTHADLLVCQGHMEGLPVDGGVYGHRGDPHLLAGPYNTNRNFSPVCNQYLGKHQIPPVMAKAKSAETQRRSPTRMAPLQK